MEWRVKAAKDGGRRGGNEVGEGKGREWTGLARDDRDGKGRRGEGRDGKGKARDVKRRENLHLRLTLTHISSCPSPPPSTLSLPLSPSPFLPRLVGSLVHYCLVCVSVSVGVFACLSVCLFVRWIACVLARLPARMRNRG